MAQIMSSDEWEAQTKLYRREAAPDNWQRVVDNNAEDPLFQALVKYMQHTDPEVDVASLNPAEDPHFETLVKQQRQEATTEQPEATPEQQQEISTEQYPDAGPAPEAETFSQASGESIEEKRRRVLGLLQAEGLIGGGM